MGPINVKIIDPLNVPEDVYTLKFADTAKTNSFGVIGTNYSELTGSNFNPFYYTIYFSDGDSVQSEVAVQYGAGNEQLFIDLGLSVTISQEDYAGAKSRNEYQNGFLTASMEYADETKPWLYFLPDGDNQDALNWIRVGTYASNEIGDCPDKRWDDLVGWDNKQYFEKILGGTWAPYRFTYSGQYGISLAGARNFQNITKYEPLSSIDLVITSDKSKWTRSCVVELCENEWEDDECGLPDEVTPWINYLSRGNAKKFALRKDPSVNKEGNVVAGDTTHGLSWFPGYAIDMRTGERLNIVFGEDSWLIGDNGADMMWNPSSNIYSTTGPIFGGKHYIYIMGNNQNFPNTVFNAPCYDSCQWIYENLLKYEETGVATTSLNRAWAAAMWCAIPLQNPDFDFLATDVHIKIRVATPYHQAKEEFAVEEPENDNFPYFEFTTADVKTITADNETAVNALDLIRVVPNPYYGNSYYEHNQLDNYVRITNLPQTCVISIYNASGSLVRQFNKDNDNPFVEWDLKNTYGISIASGVYIVHIDAPGIGEKVVKWFGAMRPVDLNNF